MNNNSLCLLCKTKGVGNQESHIIPKFFTKSIYFENGKNNLATTTRISKQIAGYLEEKPGQDLLKQKFIFCPDCEKFFEVLDTHFCNTIYKKLRNPLKEDFIFFKLRNTMASCETANEKIVLLFVASLFARCHLSTLGFCYDYKIVAKDYAVIENLLSSFSSQSKKELLAKINLLQQDEDFSYLLFSHSNNSNIDAKHNFVECDYQSDSGIYYLVVNDFVFVVYLREMAYSFPEAINNGREKVKILIMSDDEFEIARRINFNEYLKQIKLN